MKHYSYQVVKFLARKHTKDMFFTEVKDGPTQAVRNHSKIDALAMCISWSNPRIVGYEVKVSRSDFLRDNKWQSYLPMCNQLYFAVAPGVCNISDIPDVCGLIQLTANTKGLRTIKKAPWRDIEPPVNMFLHLMFKHIGPYWEQDKSYRRAERLLGDDRLQVYNDYLAGKADMKDVGMRVSEKLANDISAMRQEIKRLKFSLDDQSKARDELRSIRGALGLCLSDDILEAVKQLKNSGGISLSTLSQIRQICTLSNELLAEVERKE